MPLSIYGDSARYGQGYDQSKVTGCWMSLVAVETQEHKNEPMAVVDFEG